MRKGPVRQPNRQGMQPRVFRDVGVLSKPVAAPATSQAQGFARARSDERGGATGVTMRQAADAPTAPRCGLAPERLSSVSRARSV